jgi:hypothetical protein
VKALGRIAGIFLIGFGLAVVMYQLVSGGLIRYSVHRYPRLKEIFVSNTAFDVIYIGSSRTHTTIYPRIVDSITGLSSYNAGMEGGALTEFKMAFDGYLLHHPSPEMIVLSIDPSSFDISRQIFDPTQYFPFIRKNKFIEKNLTRVDKKTILLKYMPFLGFIYMDDYIKNNAIKGWAGQTELEPGQFDNKGFLSNGTKCIDTIKNITYTVKTIRFDMKAIVMLNTIIDTCKKRNIRLMLTYAPEYRHRNQEFFDNFGDFADSLNKIAVNNSLSFYRDDSLPLCNDPCLFANYGHTNIAGAIAYSKILGQRIKSLLLSKHAGIQNR